MTTLAQRLERALAASAGHADETSDGDGRIDALRPDDAPPVAAAVLVGFVDRPAPTVLLTRRTAHLRQHAGQVALPGGRLDPGEDAVAAAFREAEEEVGLPRALPRLVGLGARHRTITNFLVTPVVAILPPDIVIRPNPDEVDLAFELRADHLFDRANHREREVMWQGAPRRYVEIVNGPQRIWGATAAILAALGRRLGLDSAPAALNRAA